MGAQAHTSAQAGVTAKEEGKLGCPTESLHGNWELRSEPATAGEVSPCKQGKMPKEPTDGSDAVPAEKALHIKL